MAETSQLKRILQYWKNSLLAADFGSIELGAVSKSDIGLDDIENGIVPVEIVGNIFRAHTEEAKTRRRPDGVPDEINITIGLFPFQNPAQGKKISCCLFLPAVLHGNGELKPNPQSKPWIPRQLLEPTEQDLSIGTTDNFDAFVTATAWSQSPSWQDCLRYAKGMLEAVTKTPFGAFSLPKEVMLLNTHYLIDTDIVRGVGHNIIQLYDHLLNSEPLNMALLGTLVSQVKANEVASLEKPDGVKLIEISNVHTGQMRNDFSLADSQRQVVAYSLNLKMGQLIAVNGPPGTGKTTVLQSIVSSLWVNAALSEERIMPPIILGSSTNNQAIFNILDSFGTGDEGRQLVEKRWLPDIKGYGLSFPSNEMTKREGFTGQYNYARSSWQVDKPWQGLPEQIENPEYLVKARSYYLTQAKAFNSSIETLDGAIQSLYLELRNKKNRLDKILKNVAGLERLLQETGISASAPCSEICNSLEQKISCLKADPEKGSKTFAPINIFERLFWFFPPVRKAGIRRILAPYESSLKAIFQLKKDCSDSGYSFNRIKDSYDCLDRGLRHSMFHLAGRYWEGRWLIEMASVIGEKKSLGGQSEEVAKKRFSRWAMLMPCFISTMHMAPRIFSYFNRTERPLLNFIDMLVVDEAGQISPEVGGATFALAKKATVVGDIYQIEPVWSATARVDAGNIQRCQLGPEEMFAKGASCSQGSIMRMSQSATAWSLSKESSEPGLFLSEHRRCKDPIIAYCNELVYHGRLKPLAGVAGNGVTPVIGYCNLKYPSEIYKGGYRNLNEAKSIAGWIKEKEKKFEEIYRRPLQDIIAIVTPFKAHAETLRKSLNAAGIKTGQQGMTVGTVHALQGAERPIVIFSPGIDYNKVTQVPFFDRGPNMLNVAVSRAKDSFLVFGDMRLFDDETGDRRPSTILARHLFAAEENEITNVSVVANAEISSQGKILRIETHADHRALLHRALKEAKEKVLIISPYLSIKAISPDLQEELAKAAVRNVQILVVTSEDLNREHSSDKKWKDSFLEAEALLKSAGCTIFRTRRVHQKTLAVDNDWMAEGSYNWLSAVADEAHPFHRQERSLVYAGGQVKESISQEWKEYDSIKSK